MGLSGPQHSQLVLVDWQMNDDSHWADIKANIIGRIDVMFLVFMDTLKQLLNAKRVLRTDMSTVTDVFHLALFVCERFTITDSG